MSILLVDDEIEITRSLKRLLKLKGYSHVLEAHSGEEALQILNSGQVDIILLDLMLPDAKGFSLLEDILMKYPLSEIIIMTAIDKIETAVEAIRLGAFDYLVKPIDETRLIIAIERALERKGLKSGLEDDSTIEKQIDPAFRNIISVSRKMKEILAYATIMARSNNPVLITGESGTGKEIMARAIHEASSFQNGPFIPVNVTSVPESLFESQFFGHKKGAFTGASSDFSGYFEQAHKGTLFLDEIGDLPYPLQSRFLRVIEDKQVVPLGSSHPVRVDFRIIASTNVDLKEACNVGSFRLDLYYRLKSIHIHIPPLRERREDILPIANFYLKKFCKIHDKKPMSFSRKAEHFLLNYSFPGNVRELIHMVERAVLITNDKTIDIGAFDGDAETSHSGSPFDRELTSYDEEILKHTLYVLQETGWNRTEAARILGVSYRQLMRNLAKIKAHPVWSSYMK